MDKKKVTRKEFETLLKELDIWDVKEHGYGYILLSICSGLYEDAKMFDNVGCPLLYKEALKQRAGIQEFLISHGYFQN